MLANLSAIILYYFCVSNNVQMPIIIPFFIGLRSYMSLQPDGSIIKKLSFLQEKTNSDIEYYSSIVMSLFIIMYLYFYNYSTQYKEIFEYILIAIIVLYVILLIINFIYLYNNKQL